LLFLSETPSHIRVNVLCESLRTRMPAAVAMK
jgi:hypothetical protein